MSSFPPPPSHPPGWLPPPAGRPNWAPQQQSDDARGGVALAGFKIALGGFGAFVSAGFVLMGLIDVATLADNWQGALGATGLFAGLLFLSLKGLRSGLRQRKELAESGGDVVEREQQVLAIARQHGGALTVATLALDARMSVTVAQRTLDALERAGVCASEVDDNGHVSWVFPGLGAARATSPGESALDAFDAKLREAELSARAQVAESPAEAQEARRRG